MGRASLISEGIGVGGSIGDESSLISEGIMGEALLISEGIG